MTEPALKRLDADMAVAGQLQPEDMTQLAALGFVGIINNRPDGEEAGQPTHQMMAEAAEAAGLAHAHVPVTGGSLSPQAAEAFAEARSAMAGPVVAYCRSGTRSTVLWALSAAAAGQDPEDLVHRAAEAGYDLQPLRGLIDLMAGKG